MPNDKLLPCETNATPAPWSVDDTGPIACKQDIGRACVFIWGQDGEGMGAVAQVYGEAGGDAVADAELIVALRNRAQPAQSTADRTVTINGRKFDNLNAEPGLGAAFWELQNIRIMPSLWFAHDGTTGQWYCDLANVDKPDEDSTMGRGRTQWQAFENAWSELSAKQKGEQA